jgi:RND family efflux transporter MFP subunit
MLPPDPTRPIPRVFHLSGFCALIFIPQVLAADLPFSLATAEQLVLPEEHSTYGIVEAVDQATLSAQTAGHITELHFDVEDYVERGELVARIDDTEHRARVERARAGLAEASARFVEADTEYERHKDLFSRNLVSKSKMDQVSATRQAARSRRASARAQLDEAEAQLGYTEIRAPYSGFVSERYVELGEAVNPGSPIISGISLDRLRAVTQVPQRLVTAVQTHRKATIDVGGGRTVDSEDLTFFPSAQPGTSTLPVRVRFPGTIEGMFPGMYVRITFTIGARRQLLIPAEAVVQRSEVSGVYVHEGEGKLVFRQILSGEPRARGRIEVLAGLDAGESVALDPVHASILLQKQRRSGVKPSDDGGGA